MAKNEEIKALFLAEALGQYEELNKLFTQLEKAHDNVAAIKAIFRITHTLKANAASMGFEGIAELAHLLEDIFSLFKQGKVNITSETFNDLFRANDKLGDLINSVKTEKRVAYKGMSTKLKVILRELKGEGFKDTLQEAPSQEEIIAQEQESEIDNEAQIAEELEEPLDEGKKIAPAIAFSDYVQVPVKKLDQLLNLVGELVIERDRLMTDSIFINSNANELAALYRISADLQYAVMSVRLVKVDVLFSKFYRIVRDVANIEEKAVDLSLEGSDIEIDRNVLHTISESLIHLVRNAISHGIESREERVANGKNPEGIVKLLARNENDAVNIDVIDDGKGIDAEMIRRKIVEKGIVTAEYAKQLSEKQVLDYIFESGFSSKDTVSEIAGRGVGMDVVRRSIETIGGEINMKTSPGRGSTFSMVLPASMAVKKVLLFEVKNSIYAIPLTFIDSVVQMSKSELHRVGKGLMATHTDRNISIIFLDDIFASNESAEGAPPLQRSYHLTADSQSFYVVLLLIDGQWIGVAVDRLIQQKEIIEKPLSHSVQHARFISGATILGDGNVCLVIDVMSIARYIRYST